MTILPELVVFDMAGTTVHDGDAVHRCLAEALAAAGINTTRSQINTVMGLPKPRAIEIVLQEQGHVDLATVDKIHADFVERMLKFYREDESVVEIAGATNVFTALRASGVKVALDTGFSRDIADAILERLGWNNPGLLDTTVTSDEVENGRPYPDMIFEAMERTGVNSTQSVMKVGDTPSDLNEGTSARCGWVIGVTGGSHTREELEACPFTHLIHTVAELPALLGIARPE